MLIFRRTTVLVQHLVSSLLLGDCSVHRLRECSKHVEEYNKCINIKNLCVKLIKKVYHYIRTHGEQNINIFTLNQKDCYLQSEFGFFLKGHCAQPTDNGTTGTDENMYNIFGARALFRAARSR